MDKCIPWGRAEESLNPIRDVNHAEKDQGGRVSLTPARYQQNTRGCILLHSQDQQPRGEVKNVDTTKLSLRCSQERGKDQSPTACQNVDHISLTKIAVDINLSARSDQTCELMTVKRRRSDDPSVEQFEDV